MKAGDLALVEGVLRELLGEIDEDLFALSGPAVAELTDGEHEAGEWGQIVSLFCGKFEEADTLGFVGAGAGHAENPTDGRWFEAEHVVLDTDGQIGVVKRRVDGEGFFGVLAG